MLKISPPKPSCSAKLWSLTFSDFGQPVVEDGIKNVVNHARVYQKQRDDKQKARLPREDLGAKRALAYYP